MSSPVCIICKEGDSADKKLVLKPNFEHVEDLKQKVIERASLGQAHLLSLAEHFKGLSNTQDVVYHSECRKSLVNSRNLEMVRKRSCTHSSSTTDASSGEGGPALRKRGRPTKSAEGRRLSMRRSDEKILPKVTRCMFSACKFCPDSRDDLHAIKTDILGKKNC